VIDHKSLLQNLLVAAVNQCANREERQALPQEAKQRHWSFHLLKYLVIVDVQPDEESMNEVCYEQQHESEVGEKVPRPCHHEVCTKEQLGKQIKE